MMKIKSKSCIHDHVADDRNHQNLKPNTIYSVIGIDNDNYRVIDEIGEPILYPKGLFDIVDSSIPESWIKNTFPDGDYYIDPPELSEAGFYEDLFDRKPEAIKIFRSFVINNNLMTKADWEKMGEWLGKPAW